MMSESTGVPCLCCALLHFLHMEGVWKPASLAKFIGTTLPTLFAHFMPLYHTWATLTVFQTFSLLFYLFW